MTNEEAVSALDSLDGGSDGDPEVDHTSADKILLAVVSAEVAAAYQRLVDRSRWWATA